jgi:uncharacterized protein with ACT and thioredoxin-like domain
MVANETECAEHYNKVAKLHKINAMILNGSICILKTHRNVK